MWQIKFEYDWLFVDKKFDDEDLAGIGFLHKDELIVWDVPIRNWSTQRFLEDHVAVDGPDLQQKLFIVIFF